MRVATESRVMSRSTRRSLPRSPGKSGLARGMEAGIQPHQVLQRWAAGRMHQRHWPQAACTKGNSLLDIPEGGSSPAGISFEMGQ